MLDRATHRLALVAALALLGALLAGCGQHGPTLPSPNGTPPGTMTTNWASQLAAGAPVPCPIARADITLYEGPANTGPWDQRQIVAWDDNRNCGGGGAQNADVSLVLDASGSMSSTFGSTTRIQALRDAAKQLVSMMGANDRANVIEFGALSDIKVLQDFTSDQTALNTAIDGINASYGATAVWSGGKLGLDELIAKGRNNVAWAVVLVTDGGANSDTLTHQDLIDAAVAAGVPIYTVAVTDAGDPNLQKIAADTGGIYVQADDPSALTAAFQQIFQAVTGGSATVGWVTAYQPGDVIWVRLIYKEGTPDEYVIGPFRVTVKANP